MTKPSHYSVRYRLADDPAVHTDDGPFDLRADAMDHRDWFFGHSPGVVECWIDNAAGFRTGALLKRGQRR